MQLAKQLVQVRWSWSFAWLQTEEVAAHAVENHRLDASNIGQSLMNSFDDGAQGGLVRVVTPQLVEAADGDAA